MKPIGLILLLMILVSCGSQRNAVPNAEGQEQTKTRAYRVKIITPAENQIAGVLYKVEPHGVTLQKGSELIFFSIENIDIIKFRRKYAVWKGIGIGALSGAAIGAAFGFISGDEKRDPTCTNCIYLGEPPTAEDKAVGGAIAIGFLGGITGGIIATGYSTKFHIRGNPTNYANFYESLQNYVTVVD